MIRLLAAATAAATVLASVITADAASIRDDRYFFSQERPAAAQRGHRARRHAVVKRKVHAAKHRAYKARSAARFGKSGHRFSARGSISLVGVVAPLQVKTADILASCPGARVISAVAHRYVRGSGRLSLHATGRAVDISGPSPGCIYGRLKDWPGGVSTDYGAVRHVHVSYFPSGREWGARFAHYRGGRIRYARHGRRFALRAKPAEVQWHAAPIARD